MAFTFEKLLAKKKEKIKKIAEKFKKKRIRKKSYLFTTT